MDSTEFTALVNAVMRKPEHGLMRTIRRPNAQSSNQERQRILYVFLCVACFQPFPFAR